MEFHTNIEKDTLENDNYRKVISTTSNIQLVLMSLKKGEEIGLEIHDNVDQFFRIEKGKAKAIIGKDKSSADYKEIDLEDGSILIIPKGTYHNIINTGDELKLYSIYSPPNHPKDRIQHYKPLESEGGMYYNKYLKYKNKYIGLKNSK